MAGSGSWSQNKAQYRRVELVGHDDADLDQRNIEAELPQYFVVDPLRAAKMRHVSQLTDHDPERRPQAQANLDSRLCRNDPKEIKSRAHADQKHGESQDGNSNLELGNKCIATCRLEHARDDHRHTEARGRDRLKPQKLDDQVDMS